MEYLFFLRYKRSPSFYKGFDQTFTNIRAVCHHFEQVAAARSTVTRRSNKDAGRSNSGSASRSSSSSSGSSSDSSGCSDSNDSSSYQHQHQHQQQQQHQHQQQSRDGGAVGPLRVLVRHMPAAKASLARSSSSGRMGKQVCQLLARSMPSCLS